MLQVGEEELAESALVQQVRLLVSIQLLLCQERFPTTAALMGAETHLSPYMQLEGVFTGEGLQAAGARVVNLSLVLRLVGFQVAFLRE